MDIVFCRHFSNYWPEPTRKVMAITRFVDTNEMWRW